MSLPVSLWMNMCMNLIMHELVWMNLILSLELICELSSEFMVDIFVWKFVYVKIYVCENLSVWKLMSVKTYVCENLFVIKLMCVKTQSGMWTHSCVKLWFLNLIVRLCVTNAWTFKWIYKWTNAWTCAELTYACTYMRAKMWANVWANIIRGCQFCFKSSFFFFAWRFFFNTIWLANTKKATWSMWNGFLISLHHKNYHPFFYSKPKWTLHVNCGRWRLSEMHMPYFLAAAHTSSSDNTPTWYINLMLSMVTKTVGEDCSSEGVSQYF